jgi:hypothetical protein
MNRLFRLLPENPFNIIPYFVLGVFLVAVGALQLGHPRGSAIEIALIIIGAFLGFVSMSKIIANWNK